MRLENLSLLVVVGITLAACGGESVEDRARTLKSQREAPSASSSTSDPYAPAPPSTGAVPTAASTSAPAPSGSASSAYPASPLPPG